MMGLAGWIEGMPVLQGLCMALGGLLLLVFLAVYGPTRRLTRTVLKFTSQACALGGLVLLLLLLITPLPGETYQVAYAMAVVLLMAPGLALWVAGVDVGQGPAGPVRRKKVLRQRSHPSRDDI